MDPVCIIYTKCDLEETVSLLQEVCEKQDYSLWSLRGNPSHLRFPPKSVALRTSIHTEPVLSAREVPQDTCLGTAHIVSLSENKTRISFQHDDLAGNPLTGDRKHQLPKFYEFFEILLEVKEVILTDDETGGRTRVLNHLSDTGPIPA